VTPYLVELIFAALAAIFLTLYFRDYRKPAATHGPSNKARLRLGTIFAIISIVLTYLHHSE
jgi:hypothetical protein